MEPKAVKTISDEEMKELEYGDEYVKIRIPKRCNVLTVITVSDSVNGGYNYSNHSYNKEEISKMKTGE